MGPYRRSLEVLRIAEPCTVGWNRMEGDDRTRFCRVCEKNVYNLSVLTREEIDELLTIQEGNACIRMTLRADGTVVTAGDPSCSSARENTAKRRRRRMLVGGVGTAVGAAAFAALAAVGQQLEQASEARARAAQREERTPFQYSVGVPRGAPNVNPRPTWIDPSELGLRPADSMVGGAGLLGLDESE